MSKKFNPWSYKKRFHKNPGVLNLGKDNLKIKDPKIFSNHDGESCLDSLTLFPNLPRFIQAAFIDPGKVSCAIRIVRFYFTLNKIETIWFGIHNFGIGMEEIIRGVEIELDPIKEKLKICHHIIIESQFMKNEINFRTFQHMLSYIESITRNQGMRAIIFEVDIALKTTFIGGPRNKNQYGGTEIKKWSREKAKIELLNRGDYISLSVLKFSLDKQEEDLSDTFCYEFAWWFYLPKIKHLFLEIEWLKNLF